MENSKIIRVAELLKEKGIPQLMLKNRVFSDNQSIAQIVEDIEDDFQTIVATLKSDEKTAITEAVDTLNDWGKREK